MISNEYGCAEFSMVLRITFSNEPIGAYEVLCCKSCSQAGAQKGLI